MLCMIFVCGHSELVASDQVESFNVRIGTLEYNAKASRKYVFRWDNHEQVFDLSLQGLGYASGKNAPGLTDLKDFGFKTKSGLICEFGEFSLEQAVENFVKLHPNEEASALLFVGVTGEVLELKLQGSTPVCRIDLKIKGNSIALWKNLPESPVVRQRNDTDGLKSKD